MSRLLQHWIREQAERRPDAVALVISGCTVTYGELEARSNQLARLLKEAGCGRGYPEIVCCHHCHPRHLESGLHACAVGHRHSCSQGVKDRCA